MVLIDDAFRIRFLRIIEEVVDKTGTGIPAWSIPGQGAADIGHTLFEAATFNVSFGEKIPRL